MHIEVLTLEKVNTKFHLSPSCTPDFPEDEVCSPDKEWGCAPEWPDPEDD